MTSVLMKDNCIDGPFGSRFHRGFLKEEGIEGEYHLVPPTYQEAAPNSTARIHLWKNSRCF